MLAYTRCISKSTLGDLVFCHITQRIIKAVREETMLLIELAVQPEDPTRGMEDTYTKAWQEWQERYRLERLETTKRLEKQEKLTKSWELVRVCRDMIREIYSELQERKRNYSKVP